MSLEEGGAPEEIRTPDPQIRSLVLYPAELRVRWQLRVYFPAASDLLKGPPDHCKRISEKKLTFFIAPSHTG